MSIFEYNEAYKSASPLIKSAIDFISSIVARDGCYLPDAGDNVTVMAFTYNNFSFIFSELDAFTFSVECRNNGYSIFNKQFSDMELFKSYMTDGIVKGFVDDYDDVHQFSRPNGVASQNVFSDDDSDEIDSSTLDNEVSKLVSIESIVPNSISKVRVVALRYNCQVIAFRFKTDVGAFDMRIEVATKYGLGGFKTEKFINLEKVNGILMSNTEKQKRICVPDVSLCEEDCRRLIDAVFQYEG